MERGRDSQSYVLPNRWLFLLYCLLFCTMLSSPEKQMLLPPLLQVVKGDKDSLLAPASVVEWEGMNRWFSGGCLWRLLLYKAQVCEHQNEYQLFRSKYFILCYIIFMLHYFLWFCYLFCSLVWCVGSYWYFLFSRPLVISSSSHELIYS